ncbi:LacI family DNA-binding transcriptional regulator [Aeribacillus sp. FSL W8-0870]|jgi:LacI family transcriptional regulator/LacI family purine nucleotide synthesis repressor|uniref:LacI family DNA-binding transcriptional regulator n=1 Tax=Aeribacillus sp. FSL W8-0870 TaxID=2954706 RepID=UPI0030CAE294
MVTIIDIAKAAGVSKSTVSRVLSGNGSCKKETKEKVLKVAKELNYKPNRLARAMVTKKSGIIGVIIYRKHMPIIAHPFYGPILDAIVTETKKAGYSILILADDEVTGEASIELLEHQIDGAILLSRVPEQLITIFQEQNIPFVLVNNTNMVKNSNYIVNDDYLGAYDAAMHLLSKHYTKIAYISGPLEHRSYRLRWEGFQAALSAKGYEIKHYHRAIGDSKMETGMEYAYKFMQLEERPDAIFASNDMMAIGAMQTIHFMGMKIPDDVALMGFDDIEFAKLTFPALTTVRVDKKKMGGLAVSKLFALLNGEDFGMKKTILPSEVIVRKST